MSQKRLKTPDLYLLLFSWELGALLVMPGSSAVVILHLMREVAAEQESWVAV